MRRTTPNALAALVACSTALPVARPALACGGFSCKPDQFLPRGGTLPSNGVIAWWPGTDYRGSGALVDGVRQGPLITPPEALRFECSTPGSSTRAIEIDVEGDDRVRQIHPRQPLQLGDVCNLSGSDCDLSRDVEHLFNWPDPDYDTTFVSGRATFEIVDEAPLPQKLGRLKVSSAKVESIELPKDAECSDLLEACVVRTELELAAEAQPWTDAWVYETRVDGELWAVSRSQPLPNEQGGSYLGRGRELLLSLRSRKGNPGVPELSLGPHDVEIRASLPGSGVALSLRAPIDFDCKFGSKTGSEPDSGPSCRVSHVGRGNAGSGSSARAIAILGLWLAIRKRRR
jgi:hypothetical protein